MKKEISYKITSIAFGVLILCFVIAFYAIAWEEPTEAPPAGNVPSPLNTGPTGQSKEGGLILNTGGAPIGLIVDQGNVGIGTTSPATNLHIYTPVNGWRGITIDSGGSGDDQRAAIWFVTKGGDGSKGLADPLTQGWTIAARGDTYATVNDQNDLLFSYWNGTSWDQKVRIDSITGNVGIGTTSPSEKLDVAGNIEASGSICANNGADCIGGGGGGAFGTRVSRDTSGADLTPYSVYRAQTDGYFLVTKAGGNPDNIVRVGKTNPPTNIVGVHSWSSSTTYGSISIPVPANEYVQLTGGYIAGNPDIWWQPIGVGGLVKQ